MPTIIMEQQKRPRGRPRKATAKASATPSKEAPTQKKCESSERPKPSPSKPGENHQVCDNANTGEDSFGIQQSDLYGAGRIVAQWRDWKEDPLRRKSAPALRKTAFAMLEPLSDCHWDNCKVTFARRTAFQYALHSLSDGHRAERIISCYADALYVTHGFAVDRAGSTGKITFFNLSSTVVKARKLLARDGMTRGERVRNWYSGNRPAYNLPIDEEELARVHAQVLATFPP